MSSETAMRKSSLCHRLARHLAVGARLAGRWLACLLPLVPANAADLLASMPPTSTEPSLLEPARHSLMVFGGPYTSEFMSRSLVPFAAETDRQGVVAIAVGHDLVSRPRGANLGIEAGAAHRFGSDGSFEGWAGIGLRYRGIVLFETLHVIPGITAGFSFVNRTTGIEAVREDERGGNAHTLGYFSPEVALALESCSNIELVYRLHHRSGLFGAIGNMIDGANANTLGLRYRF